MKKIFYILTAAVVALGAMACENEGLENVAPEVNGNVESLSFTAAIDNSRVALEGLNNVWVKGDVVEIDGFEFVCQEDGVTFVGEGDGIRALIGKEVTAWYNETIDSSKGVAGASLKGTGVLKEDGSAKLTFALQSALLKYTTAETVAFTGTALSAGFTPSNNDGVQYIPVKADENLSVSYSVDGVTCKSITTNFEAGQIYNLGELTAPVVLVLNNNWKSAGNYIAYFCNGESPAAAVDMTEQNDGTYLALLPEGDFKNVIFCRVNDTMTAATFEWNENVWDQTATLNIPTAGSNRHFWMVSWKGGFWKQKDWNYGNGKVHFLTLGSDWSSANADYRVWCWGSPTANDAWIYASEVATCNTVLAFDFKDYTEMIFLRANPGSSAWDNEWNRIQTKITAGKNHFVVSGWSAGSWSTMQ